MLKRDLISYLGKFVQVSYLDVCYETVQGFLVYDRKTRLFTVVACPQDPHFSGFTVGFEAADFFASQVFDCWESMRLPRNGSITTLIWTI